MSPISQKSPAQQIASILEVLHPKVRIEILLILGKEEHCVCHLENALGLRQAYLSQHLMALRKAGVIQTRRSGRFIFYRLSDSRVLSLLQNASAVAGGAVQNLSTSNERLPDCSCPACRNDLAETRAKTVVVREPA